MSWVPLPWCASQSTMRTLAPRSRSAAAATATLLSRQKPIACVGSGVVPGRPDRAERGGARRPAPGASIAARPEPGGEERGVPGRGRRGGVGVEGAAAAGAERLELIEVGGGVDPLELGARRPPGGELARRLVQAGGLQSGEDGLEPGRALRVPAAGIVLGQARIGRDQQHRRRVASPVARPLRQYAFGSHEGAVVPISRRRRPDRGLARTGRRRVARGTRPRATRVRVRRAQLLDRVRAAGYREVVTNALAPAATLPLVDAGFAVRGRLRVLVHDFDGPARDVRADAARPRAANAPRSSPRTRPRSTTSGSSTPTVSGRPRARRRARTCA